VPSERVQRQVDQLLDEIETARARHDWGFVRELAQEILDLDPENDDAVAFLAAAGRREQRLGDGAGASAAPVTQPEAVPQPTSFGSGRYVVERFLGEGGKKSVYLAHDSLLDRDVAFALIKTEGLDGIGRERVQREAQAMGRLGAHPQIVSVFDLGEEDGQPFIVTELMGGGDVEGLIEMADQHRLTFERVLEIGLETCRGLEFAHEKGIVHRDLKPGNVWLTADGRAKIGDFGLAVAVDRSRLTQAGMMVGTVSYMPPEQAMGGEVGPRSDLYSLGAMLYEMVCGRPPFLGDESVAIIGQHLNAQPVAPSWHRPDCPGPLEVLIMQLLEKDPAQRPASAAEVSAALASLSRDDPVHSGEVGVSPLGYDPLYRRTFVGREQELKQLHQAFDAALSGEGSLAVVVGEPGIGKTTLCEQLATYVALRSGKTLVGHCYEEGSLSLPYLAFVEAMRTYVLGREPEGLRSDLGSGAADVARIVSEIRDRVHVELRPSGDAQDDRFRLLQAVGAFLANVSSVQPLLIVLEDLHWADMGTLELLQHVARSLQGARLLLVGTYRDVEVDRSHALSGALAELRRSGSFLRVPLRGLTVDEVHRMYEQLRGQEVPWSQAELVYRQTEGNPLFVQEVLRFLVEEGLVVREGGRYVPREGSSTTLAIPEGLRDVIGKRLSHLGEQTNELLAVASVIGRDFDLETLRRVTELAEEPFIAAIEEALAVAVLEERSRPGGVGYRFAHAFFHQTLYEELSAPRRLRQHQQVARALEAQHANRLEEHAPELAEHFSQSTDRDDLAKAVHYCELAANRAVGVYAYRDAARLLEQALDVQEVVDHDDGAKRCDLLLALGAALVDAGEARRVLDDIAARALALAQTLDDRELASRACTLALTAFFEVAGPFDFDTPEAARWLELADSLAPDGSPARVQADIGIACAAQARVLVMADGWEDASGLCRPHLVRAREVAHALGDPALVFQADFHWIDMVNGPQDLAQRLAVADELAAMLDQASPRHAAWAYLWLADVYVATGSRERADAMITGAAELAERSHHPVTTLFAIVLDGLSAALDGRFEAALLCRDRLLAHGKEASLDFAQVAADAFFTWPRVYAGRSVDPATLATPALGTRLRATAPGQPDGGVRAELDRVATARATIEVSDDEVNTWTDACLMQAAALNRHEPTARQFLRRYADGGQMTFGIVTPACTARLLGDAATVLGDRTSARGYYEQARVVATRLRLRPEGALAALGLAEGLIAGDQAEQSEAQRHLDFAIAEFQEMKMQPSLERALAHKGLLKA
jgi:eukaryotic-like serine/threonine-protein kinase